MANLITAQTVVDTCFTNGVDTNLILPSVIDLTQEEYFRDILGSDYYDELIAENDSGFTADNQSVYDLLVPSLAFYVAYEVAEDLNINSTSQGLMVNRTEFSDSASRNDIAAWASQKLKHGNALRDKMIRFIESEKEDDSTKYPLYKQGDYSNSEIIGGVVFDGTKVTLGEDVTPRAGE